jgi:hypothetical protein
MQISHRPQPVSSPKCSVSGANTASPLAFQTTAEQPKDQVTFSGRKDKIGRKQEAGSRKLKLK